MGENGDERMMASMSPLYFFKSSWLNLAASLERSNLKGGWEGVIFLEFITRVSMRMSHRWLDLGLGLMKNGTPARVPSRSGLRLLWSSCPLAGGALGLCLHNCRTSLMGFVLLASGDMGDSLSGESNSGTR